MYLLWLRVAAILYAAASVAVFPGRALQLAAVAQRPASIWAGWRSSSISSRWWKCWWWRTAGCRSAFARSSRCWDSPWQACFSWFGGFMTPSLLESLPCRLRFSWFLSPRWVRTAYTFPQQGVYTTLACGAHHRAAAGLRRALLQPAVVDALSHPGAPHQVQNQSQRKQASGRPLDWLPPLDTLERIGSGHPRVRLSLHDDWPRSSARFSCSKLRLAPSYFLDPNILASFVMWIVYVVLLLVRRSAGLRGRKAAYVSGAVARRHDGGLGGQLLQPGAQVRSPMTLAIIGVNHKTAPIALRERIAIGREELPETTRALAAMPGVAECMIVSTCNRVELRGRA